MTQISDTDLATLRTKLNALADANEASNTATAARVEASTAADAALATFHQTQLEEATADANEASAVLDLRTFVDSLFDAAPPGDPTDPNMPADELSPVTPVTASTLDRAVLYTVPDGPSLRITKCELEVQTPFAPTGATAGVSSSNPNSSSPGDLLTSSLTPGPKVGTAVLSPGDQILWNVTAPGFTSGRAVLHVSGVAVDPVDIPPFPAPTFARARR